MPNKSNSKDPKINTKTDGEDIEILPEDLDFWNIDSKSQDIEPTSEDLIEIDKILSENELNRPLKTLSEQEVNLSTPCDKEIINELDSHLNIQQAEEFSTATIDTDINEEAPSPPVPIKENTPRSSIETLASIFCYIVILGIFAYLINYASHQHNFDSESSYESNIPINGQYANIEKIETFWSKPEGKYRLALVPAATITLSNKSGSGIIRSAFFGSEKNAQGNPKPKGDAFSYEFRQGKFNSSGTNQITIHGTDGFKELAHFIYYRSQTEKRWTIELKEAPSILTNDNSFQPLGNVPIEPLRK